MPDQRGQLLRAAVGFAGCSMLSYDRALWALRTWLDSWPGVGPRRRGDARQGFDLQLTQYNERGWRATFYTRGMEHSPTSATDAWASSGLSGERATACGEGGFLMLARVVTIHVRPEKMDECIKIFRERNAPSIAAQPGFHHGHWWVDRVSGVATSVTFWDDAAGERASRTNIPGLVERMADVLATHDVYQETFESVHDQYLPGKRE